MKQISLTQGRIAFVDDEDFERLSVFKWHFHRVKGRDYGYARTKRGPEKKAALMHRLLINAPQIDHVNGDRLDNRRENLRPATQAQNSMNRGLRADNTSGYKGVSFDNRAQRWVARCKATGRYLHLGFYDTPEEAALAYNGAALRYFGDFAVLNKVSK